MPQLFFLEPGRVEWREVSRPTLQDSEDALVRPIAVATCDLDTALIAGKAPFPGPFPIGHEGVGEVLEIGSAVTSVEVGQRVVIPFQISCGRCSRCTRGLTASCEAVNPGAMYGLEPFGGPWGGFLGDAVRVPWANHMLVPLPAGLDPAAVASLSDNIPDGWRTVAPYITDPADSSVLVIAGASPSISFYSVAIASALGVAAIDYLQFDSTRALADKAARLGARVLGGPEEVEPQRYTVSVCSVADPDALKLALRATEPDGACVSNAVFFGDDVPVPMFAMYTRGARLISGRVNARAVLPAALDLAVAGRFRPGEITDAVVPWADVADALVGTPQKLVVQR